MCVGSVSGLARESRRTGGCAALRKRDVDPLIRWKRWGTDVIRSSSSTSQPSARHGVGAQVSGLLVAVAGVPIGFGVAIRLLYSADIPLPWGRSLWWVIFGACLALGAGAVAR